MNMLTRNYANNFSHRKIKLNYSFREQEKNNLYRYPTFFKPIACIDMERNKYESKESRLFNSYPAQVNRKGSMIPEKRIRDRVPQESRGKQRALR